MSEDNPKIRNVSNPKETDGLINYLTVILNIKCVSKEEIEYQDMQMIVILDFIKSKFGFLTIPEIREAFKMYVAKDFGHKDIFRNLDTILVSDVLNCFMNFRAEKLRAYNQKKQKLELAEKTALSNSEKETKMTIAVNNKFSEFLETGSISHPIVHIFDELIDRKIIKKPEETTNYYYCKKLKQASEEISRELKSTTPSDKKERLSLKEELEKIVNNTSKKVEIRAKKLVLIDFFKKQKELGKHKII